MIEALLEDLNTLSDTVPLLSKAVSTASFEADALENAARDLLQEVTEGRQYLNVHRAAVHEALPPLTAHVREDLQALRTAGDDAETAWHEARDAISAGEQRLGAKVGEVVAAAGHLEKVLAEAGTRVDQLSGKGEAALDLLEQKAQEAQTRLKTPAETPTAETGQMRQFLSLAKSTLDEAAQRLAHRLLEIGESLEPQTTELGEETTAKLSEHLEKVQTPVDGLYAYASAGVAELAERSRRMIGEPVSHVETDLAEELGRPDASGQRD